jgi:hypothetical protein
LLNEKCLGEIVQFLVDNPRHEYFWNRFYRPNAVLRTQWSSKIIESLTPLSKLWFDIELETACDLQAHRVDLAQTKPVSVEGVADQVTSGAADMLSIEEGDRAVVEGGQTVTDELDEEQVEFLNAIQHINDKFNM